jgi:DNA-binding transcriptional regulator YhcF (GntR family)
MGKKLNHKGRNVRGEPFVQIPHFVMDSPAYRSLTALSQALLNHIIRRHNGFNNGAIPLGHREAASLCNVNKDTIKRAFDELQNRGLIQTSRPGGFNIKDPTLRRATEWRLSWLEAAGEKATYDFKQWLQGSEA